jgi:hypothetical protein
MMMNRIFLACLLAVTQLTLKAQVLKKVQSTFDAYHQNTFQEKLFIHTDKELYLTGELLWFKIYNVDALTNKAVDLSKVAYVEILDQNNQPVVQAKIALKNGSGNGSVYIPLTLLNGTYKLRAYTNWMQNFGADHYFEKQLTLINPLNSPEKPKKTKVDQELLFFPEGGDLVEGIACNIGFKALGADGKGLDIKGVIINQKNDTVARFQSLKFGIGRFTFTPEPNNTYKAIAGITKKEILIKELPIAKKQGYAISLVDDANASLTLNIGTNLNVQNVYLFVHDGGKTTIASTANVVQGKAVFQIDKVKLGEGLSHLTVFNEAGQAVCERLYFKRPTHKLKIEANANLSQYTARKKVNVNVLTRNENGELVDADLSVAVRRLDSLQGMDQSDIVSYFWLSAELKGNIESPGYYFSNQTTETNKALDNLLLTQGWRRFAWDNLPNKNPASFTFLPEFNGHLISGYVKPSSVANVYLSVAETKSQFYSTESDSTGHFIFNTRDYYGNHEIIVQTNPNVDTTSVISIQSPFSALYNTFDFADLAIKPSLLNELQNHSFGVQVQNIYTAAKLRQFNAPVIDTNMFYVKPYKTYLLDDYTRFNLMEDVLREYVTESFVSKSQKSFRLKVLSRQGLLEGNPLVLVDGAPYFNMDRVMEIDPKKISKLEIIRDQYYYGPSIFDGVLNFSSYKPNLANLEINPNTVVLDYEGMQLQREFYVPSYETAAQQNSRIPDFRNLLYWSPSVSKGQISFYTSDLPGTYIGLMNGISKDGVPGNGVFTFEVK